jgi:hypothetical protein
MTAEFVINSALRRAFERPELDFERIHSLLDSARREGVNLDSTGLEFVLRQRMVQVMNWYRQEPMNLARLQTAHAAISLARTVPFTVNLWKAQNLYYELLQTLLAQPRKHEGEASEWAALFAGLGELLGVAVSAPVLQPAVTV